MSANYTVELNAFGLKQLQNDMEYCVQRTLSNALSVIENLEFTLKQTLDNVKEEYRVKYEEWVADCKRIQKENAEKKADYAAQVTAYNNGERDTMPDTPTYEELSPCPVLEDGNLEAQLNSMVQSYNSSMQLSMMHEEFLAGITSWVQTAESAEGRAKTILNKYDFTDLLAGKSGRFIGLVAKSLDHIDAENKGVNTKITPNVVSIGDKTLKWYPGQKMDWRAEVNRLGLGYCVAMATQNSDMTFDDCFNQIIKPTLEKTWLGELEETTADGQAYVVAAQRLYAEKKEEWQKTYSELDEAVAKNDLHLAQLKAINEGGCCIQLLDGHPNLEDKLYLILEDSKGNTHIYEPTEKGLEMKVGDTITNGYKLVGYAYDGPRKGVSLSVEQSVNNNVAVAEEEIESQTVVTESLAEDTAKEEKPFVKPDYKPSEMTEAEKEGYTTNSLKYVSTQPFVSMENNGVAALAETLKENRDTGIKTVVSLTQSDGTGQLAWVASEGNISNGDLRSVVIRLQDGTEKLLDDLVMEDGYKLQGFYR